ncbi:MAG: hypothetical protein Q9M92_15740 [Enterobacterales bacterium]|nr:hypothetical protein [Enterobacterales bacterium]
MALTYWGQEQLGFSAADNQKLVDAINQKLMAEDERLVSYGRFQWLYLSKKAIALEQTSYKNYIGRDMFAFKYQGDSAKHWQMLATEIQMLIKQMIDYEGLTAMPPEWIAHVHFSGQSDPTRNSQNGKRNNHQNHYWPDLSSQPTQLVTDEPLLSTYAAECQIPQQLLAHFEFAQQFHSILKPMKKPQAWLVFEQAEISQAQATTERLLQFCQQHAIDLKIIMRDQTLRMSHSTGFFKRILQCFRR